MVVAKFFVLFDQDGLDSLPVLSIKIAISLLGPGLDNKLNLFYKSNCKNESQLINSYDFTLLICKIDETAYKRNSFYRKNSFRFAETLENLSQKSFIFLLKTDIFFQSLVFMLELIDSDKIEDIRKEILQPELYYHDFPSPDTSPIALINQFSGGNNMSNIKIINDIEIIGEKSLEISVLTNESEEHKLKHTVNEKMNTILRTFDEDKYDDTFEVVKDPEFLEEFENKSIKSNKTENKEFLEESLKEIDYLPNNGNNKDRNSCSRLCGNQSCVVT